MCTLDGINNMEFKVGDIVEWCGNVGTVTSVTSYVNPQTPVMVSYREHDVPMYFTEDGKVYPWNKKSSLKLIFRAKIKKYQVLNKVNGEFKLTWVHFESKEEFEKMVLETGTNCEFIKLVEETMIEVNPE